MPQPPNSNIERLNFRAFGNVKITKLLDLVMESLVLGSVAVANGLGINQRVGSFAKFFEYVAPAPQPFNQFVHFSPRSCVSPKPLRLRCCGSWPWLEH